MARSKSISGGKANRSNPVADTNTNIKEQAASPANIPDVKAVAAKTAPVEAKPEANIAPEPRKLEVVKTEARKNVTPISQNVVPINLEDEIRRRAYELYLQRGPASGTEAEDWFNAEREIRQRYRQQQSA